MREEGEADPLDRRVRRRLDGELNMEGHELDVEVAFRQSGNALKRNVATSSKPRGRGAPIRAFKRVGKFVTMPVKTHKRLLLLQEQVVKLKKELSALRLELARKLAPEKSSKGMRAAAVSAMISFGVSETKVPHILAASSMYYFGKVVDDDLLAATTAGQYVLQVSDVLKQRLANHFSSNPGSDVTVCLDSSTRSGSVCSFIFGFVDQNGDVCDVFEGFKPMLGGTADLYVEIMGNVISSYPSISLLAIGTDAPSVMVGEEAGFGVLLCKEYEKFIRHDTCEKHGAASVLRVLEAIWPAQMNVPGVCQVSFLCWYILNSDWAYYKGLMITELRKKEAQMDDDVIDMIKTRMRANGTTFLLECEDIVSKKLLKPSKPTSTRWETLSDMILFVNDFWPLLLVAFDDFRELQGSGAPAMSIAAMCSQFIKWCGSKQMLALLSIGAEFVGFWKRHNRCISFDEDVFGQPVHHRVFTRPSRSLLWLMESETIVADVTKLKSFASVLSSFPGKGEEIKSLYEQLYSLALDRIKRNCGRYLSGVYLLGGFGDPEFVPILFEGLTNFLKSDLKPSWRSRHGLRLEKWLNNAKLSGFHAIEFARLTARPFLLEMQALLEIVQPVPTMEHNFLVLCLPSSEQNEQFVKMISESKTDSFLQRLYSWRACFSNTQIVERSFLTLDTVKSNGSYIKGKASMASGKQSSFAPIESRVRVVSKFHEHERYVLKERDDPLKRPQAKSKHDISVTVMRFVKELEPSKQEWALSKEHVTAAKKLEAVSRSAGMSKLMEERIRDGNEEYAIRGEGYVRKSKDVLMKEGSLLAIPVECLCFSDERCEKKGREKKKGNPGELLSCEECLRKFHRKCLVKAELVPKKKPGKTSGAEKYTCGRCSGTDEDHDLYDMNEAALLEENEEE